MKSLLSLIIVFFTMALTVAAAEIVFPGTDWETSLPEAQGIDSGKLNAAMEHVKKICKSDGNSQCVVIRNGYLIWQGDDIDRKHHVWSCTKSFTSTCLGLLWDDGKCSPQDKIARWIPELREHYPDATLEHFATFTSGYNYDGGNVYAPLPPLFPLGTRMRYCAETEIISWALTKAGGKKLKDLFAERVAKPLCFKNEDWDWVDYPVACHGEQLSGGSGESKAGIYITARQMARLCWLFANGGTWNGKRIVSQRYIDYACRPRVPVDLPPYQKDGWYKVLPGAYGLNWWTNGVNERGKRLWPDAPEDTFLLQGNLNNHCFIIPSWKMVIVRLGHDGNIDNYQYNDVFRLIKEGMSQTGTK